jgi:hypothetical protein
MTEEKHQSELKRFMPASVREQLGNSPTWHSTLMEITGGTKRPGKTAKDRSHGNT